MTSNSQIRWNYSQQLIDRILILSKSPVAAALAWQGYLFKGRGLVNIRPDRTASTQLVVAHYYSLEQFWATLDATQQKQQMNRSVYDLLSSYSQLTEYIVCYPKNTLGELEIACVEHIEPPAEHRTLKSIGFFQSGDGLLITFDRT